MSKIIFDIELPDGECAEQLLAMPDETTPIGNAVYRFGLIGGVWRDPMIEAVAEMMFLHMEQKGQVVAMDECGPDTFTTYPD